MALILKDRVLETSQTGGTGIIALAGPVNAYQSFSSAIGNGNTTYYTIEDNADGQWEVGIGTVGAGTLTRNTVLSSSNGGSLVNFGTSIKNVFCDYPASKAASLDSNEKSTFGGNNYQNYASIAAPSYVEGRVWYDSTEKALAFYNDSSALAVHVGQDLIVKVINNTGSTIANGSPVYITSTSSGQTYPNVALAKADVAATSSIIGLTNGAIANGAIGYVTSQGTIDNVNTGTFTVGQPLYLSPYSAGQIMNTIPPTGITVQVGVVSYVDTSVGKIYVKQTAALSVPASIITGTVAVANGGTGQSSPLVAGSVVYGASTTAMGVTAAGTTGAVLTSNGASAPTWSTTAGVTQSDVGSAPNQIPLNQYLGKLAFEDVVDTISNNPYYDTAISDVQPTLNLDFVNSKTLDPRITFARSTTATYYDAKSSAVAEQNLVLQSQTFGVSPWSAAQVTVTANSTTAPDGTSTASTLTFTASGTLSRALFQSATVSASVVGATYTKSFYAKYVSQQYIQIPFATSSTYANFDIQNGTLGSTGANVTSSITSVGNGWYRCVATYTATATATDNFYFWAVDSSTAGYAANSTAGGAIYVWGAQHEQRSSATAYTPTTTAAITNYIPTLQTAAANVARLDYNPITRVPNGLLIEESRTNLVTYSSNFSQAAQWPNGSSLIINTTADIAPDGTQTANTLVATTSSVYQRLAPYYASFTSGTAYSFSIYAKQYGYKYLSLNCGAAFNASSIFDLNSGTVFSTASGTATISSVGNGWYRCTVTGTATVTIGQNYFFGIVNTNGIDVAWTGNGYSGIYIWGAQLEAGAFPTSYIPTVASQVTRSADAASMTGTNFSSWFNGQQGTIYTDFVLNGQDTTHGAAIATLFFSSATNGYMLYRASNSPAFYAYIDASLSSSLGSIIVGTSNKSSLAYNGSTNGALLNAGTVYSVGTYASQQPIQMNIFAGSANDNRATGYIKKLQYYPVRLPNAELQEMTA